MRLQEKFIFFLFRVKHQFHSKIMPPPCDIEICKRKSRALCHCCSKNLCPDHLREHDDSFNSQLNPIVDELNAVADQFLKMNVNNVISNCRQKLDKWRDDCYTMIDRFYEEKCEELQRRCLERADQQRKQIDQMKLKTSEFIREQEATYEDIPPLILTINDIKRDVNHFEENGILVDVHPLTINKDLIYIEEWPMNNVDISSLSLPLRTIDCSDDGWPAMTCNDQFLLFDQYPRLSLLDRELTIVKESSWEYSRIPDMCWSSTLNKFIITTEQDGVFLVNENLTSITPIQTIEKMKWLSCTCSDNVLFLTKNENGCNIFQFNLLSSFRLIKQWNPPESGKSGESIHNLAYHNGILALIIHCGPDNRLKIELRSSTTLNCLYSLPLNLITNGGRIIRVCSLRCDEWLVIAYKTSYLLQISKDGKLKFEYKYKSTPHNAILFGSNILAIRTDTCIDFSNV
jgi:hypothetical protein